MNPPNLYTYENSYLTSASDLAISFGASLTIIAESGAGESSSNKSSDTALRHPCAPFNRKTLRTPHVVHPLYSNLHAFCFAYNKLLEKYGMQPISA